MGPVKRPMLFTVSPCSIYISYATLIFFAIAVILIDFVTQNDNTHKYLTVLNKTHRNGPINARAVYQPLQANDTKTCQQ